MLDLGRYLLGVAEILLLGGFASLAAAALRTRLLPGFHGAPAHLATAVMALALLVWVAELLGAFGLFEPVPYLLGVAAIGVGTRLAVGGGWGHPSALLGFSPGESAAVGGRGRGEKQDAAASEGYPHPPSWAVLLGLAIAAVAVVKFGIEVKPKLTTGMTGFDSTWYHGPFAAAFFQSGSTWDLHFIAPQFLAWLYPANAEIFHGAGMLAFGRDLLSPLLNTGWFVGCLVACWCIGRPYRVAPWSLALGAIALSLPVLSDQAGEARNDVVGVFFLLAAVAIALNAANPGAVPQRLQGRVRSFDWIPQQNANAVAVAALAAGLAAGTKLNFLLPAAFLVAGMAFLAPAGRRWRSLGLGTLAALAGGGYWYLRNLLHTGNPLPWLTDIGPISLPGPEQELGGREGHSMLGYLFDGTVWSDWFLPGLADALTALWPLALAFSLAGLLLSLGRKSSPALRVASLVGLAATFAWLVAPTSASGPDGMPRGFESGLRYLAPALVLGLSLLPIALLPRVARRRGSPIAEGAAQRRPSTWGRAAATGPAGRGPGATGPAGRGPGATGPAAVAIALLAAIALGYPVQRHYLDNRYANPTFAAPGLNAAFAWSRDVSDARIATTGTRQHPLFGTDLSNRVQFLGEPRPQGGFIAPTTCRRYRRLLNEGGYDYVIATRDRIEPNKPPYPPSARWTESLGTQVILREPPTIVFQLSAPLDPSACK